MTATIATPKTLVAPDGFPCTIERATELLATYDMRKQHGYKNQEIAARDAVKLHTGMGVRDLRKFLAAQPADTTNTDEEETTVATKTETTKTSKTAEARARREEKAQEAEAAKAETGTPTETPEPDTAAQDAPVEDAVPPVETLTLPANDPPKADSAALLKDLTAAVKKSVRGVEVKTNKTGSEVSLKIGTVAAAYVHPSRTGLMIQFRLDEPPTIDGLTFEARKSPNHKVKAKVTTAEQIAPALAAIEQAAAKVAA